jgi:hypothetical protein
MNNELQTMRKELSNLLSNTGKPMKNSLSIADKRAEIRKQYIPCTRHDR